LFVKDSLLLNEINPAETNVLLDLNEGDGTFKVQGGESSLNYGSVEIGSDGGVNIALAGIAPIEDYALKVGGFEFTGLGTPRTETSATESLLTFGPLIGDFDQGLSFEQSNAINALGYAWCNAGFSALLGSQMELQQITVELDTNVAADYVSQVRVVQRNPDSISPLVLHSEAVTWGQGTTGHDRYNLTLPASLNPIRPWAIELTCTNATSNSIKVTSILCSVHFTGI